ncbi:helix-turn-helix domain-containing protein, partial [Herbiconiux daphne]
MEVLGKRMRAFRKEALNLTLQEVAQISGAKYTTLASFEVGKSSNLSNVNYYIKCAEKTLDENQVHTYLHEIEEIVMDYTKEVLIC